VHTRTLHTDKSLDCLHEIQFDARMNHSLLDCDFIHRP